MVRLTNEIKPQHLSKGAQFLFDLYWTTYQALVDAAGSEHALNLIKPYLKFHGVAGGQIIINHFKLKKDDLLALAVFFKLICPITWGTRHKNFQFFDHGFFSDIHYCPYQNLSESLCHLNELQINSTIPAMNDNYEYIHTKMLIKGDPSCQAMVKEKSHTLWGKVKMKPVEVPIPEISYEETEFWQCANYSQSWIYMTNALLDYAGKDKATEILRPYMKALGKTITVDLSKELGIKDRDAISITLIIDQCNRATNQKGEYLVHTPDRVEKEITKCIFASASQDICSDALEARANGICEAVNPDYEFHLTKRMCKGDKVCHWIINKK